MELATATKLFSASPNRFGDEPNVNIDPGHARTTRRACRCSTGTPSSWRCASVLALNCTIQPCTFHRKNYFYPDMPKAYQISQYDQPLNVDGFLELPERHRIGIERAHLEEDTGKSTHVGGTGGRIHGSDYSLIDFNRAGVPLVEIVSRPDIRTSEEAREYVTELRAILVAVGASDAKMEEGSMRCDANVSVHKPGTPYGTRCEIKNVNSIRSLGRAIEYEARRQIAMLQATARPSARRRATGTRTTAAPTPCGSKEDADDYRYFLEPDLVPLEPRRPSGSKPMSATRCRCYRAARRARLAEAHRGGARDSEADRWSWSNAARTTTCSPSRHAGGDIRPRARDLHQGGLRRGR